MDASFNDVGFCEHSLCQQRRLIAAHQDLLWMFFEFVANLLHFTRSLDVAAFDEDDAVGHGINFVQNMAGNNEV